MDAGRSITSRNGKLIMQVTLAKNQPLSVVVFDTKGHRIASVHKQRVAQGTSSIDLGIDGLAPGYYVANMRIGETMKHESVVVHK